VYASQRARAHLAVVVSVVNAATASVSAAAVRGAGARQRRRRRSTTYRRRAARRWRSGDLQRAGSLLDVRGAWRCSKRLVARLRSSKGQSGQAAQ
jgi:hypothetical protein